ncbi:MAG TPA: TIGR04211 family SH3 domain-containing protein [Gammaproteobacteria bacterium]|nr:TIGR04211 family SH3 domain-containing protein [Gammaproteobacteria bacterium]
MLVLATTHVHAETVKYISDQLQAPVRSGPSTKHKILRMLNAGKQVVILENAESGWSKIQISNEDEGWVLTRYLMNQPAARDRLAQAESQLAKYQNENSRLKRELQQVSSQSKELSSTVKQVKKDNTRLSQEYESLEKTASSAIAIDAERMQLKNRLAQLEQEFKILEQQNARLTDRSKRDWFIVGAAVLFVGFVLGLIIPRIRWNRKQSWDSF